MLARFLLAALAAILPLTCSESLIGAEFEETSEPNESSVEIQAVDFQEGDPALRGSRRLVDDSSCFASHVATADLPNLYPLIGGTSSGSLGMCSSPFACEGSGFTRLAGNTFHIHASGFGGTWSPSLENSQSPTSCDNVADWKTVGNTAGTIEYRTCKVTSPTSPPGNMWFAAVKSDTGTIDGFRFGDHFASGTSWSSDAGWVPSSNDTSAGYSSSVSYPTTGSTFYTSGSVMRRRVWTPGKTRGHFTRVSLPNNNLPSINHLVIVPDELSEWSFLPDWWHSKLMPSAIGTKTAPVHMLLAVTWAGTENHWYNESFMEAVMDATVASPCFWTNCPLPTNVPNASSQVCSESAGASIRHGTACTIQCETHFTPSTSPATNPAQLSCARGVLSPATFQCIGPTCVAPVGIANAASPSCTSASTPMPHGSSCIPTCNTGYTPNVTSLHCHLGNLTPNFFGCVPNPCAARTDLGIEVKTPSCLEGAIIPHGGNCTPSCIANHVPTRKYLWCDTGTLYPLTGFVCVGLPCPMPTGIENAAQPPCTEGLTHSTIDHGGKCTAACSFGYKPSRQFIPCSMGNYTVAMFQCNPAPCTAPATIPNSIHAPLQAQYACVEGLDILHFSNCTGRCQQGYYADPPTLQCLFSQLSPLVFACLETGCPVTTGIPNAATPPCAEGDFIKSEHNCTTQCALGYAASVLQLSCLRGDLTPPDFYCIGAPCVAPSAITYRQGLPCDSCTSVRSSPSCLEGSQIQSGHKCTARCDPGFYPDVYSLECHIGFLYPSTFTCTESLYGFDHNTQLLTACHVSDADRVDRIIAMGADVAFANPAGDTALHLCTLRGKETIIRRLLSAKASVNAMNSRGWTPLHVAASRGHVTVVKEFLANGGDVALMNHQGSTPGDLARTLAKAVPPQLGRSMSAAEEVSLVFMQAERLRANQDCSLKHICPSSAGLAGGGTSSSSVSVNGENNNISQSANLAEISLTNVFNLTHNGSNDTGGLVMLATIDSAIQLPGTNGSANSTNGTTFASIVDLAEGHTSINETSMNNSATNATAASAAIMHPSSVSNGTTNSSATNATVATVATHHPSNVATASSSAHSADTNASILHNDSNASVLNTSDVSAPSLHNGSLLNTSSQSTS